MKAINRSARGFTLLEVLITIVILAIGLLGLTSLQTKLHMSEMEAYQRAQAVVLLQDFANRLQANGDNAASYVTVTPLGTVAAPNALVDCTGMSGADLDKCEWGNQLKGGSESTGGQNIGAMIGARGCVEQLQAPAVATCTPGRYRVTIAWQGLYETSAPGLTCAQNQYGNEALRRVMSTTITVGLPKCL